MTEERTITRLVRRAIDIVTPLACVGFGLWIAYMGGSWYLAMGGGMVAGALALIIARARGPSDRSW